ncbi:MAG: PAS domain S-box protein [Armatimonadota bacterium]|nr:PAS domain S-box protein [Armatimonadota bacterium]
MNLPKAVPYHGILSTSPEEAFERIAHLAALLYHVPIAWISLIDSDRKWLKACFGLDVPQAAHEISFLAEALSTDKTSVISDTNEDERFSAKPLLTGGLQVRFCATVPLRGPDGSVHGALGIVDFSPRQLSDSDQATLSDLAAFAVDELEMRVIATNTLKERAERESAEQALLKAREDLGARLQDRTAELARANAALTAEISERIRTEEALRDSERRFRSVVQSANDAIISADNDGRVVFWNQAAETTFGYREEEVLGQSLTLLMPGQFVEAHLQGMARYQATGEPHVIGNTVELDGLRKDGIVFPLELSLASWINQGETFFTGTVRDITRRKENEAALKRAKDELEIRVEERTSDLARANEELRLEIVERQAAQEKLAAAQRQNNQLAVAINSSATGVLITDPCLPDNPTIFANPAFTAVTGYTAEDILGQNCRFLQGENTDPLMVNAVREAVEVCVPFKGTLLNYRKNGEPFWNELTVNPVFDEEGTLVNFVGLQADVTARVVAEEALQQAKDAAEQATRAKSDFLSRMSHELRTPMNSILGFSQLLEMDSLTPKQHQRVGYILTAGRHLLDLINEVLDLARVEAGRLSLVLEPVMLQDTVDEALALIGPQAAQRKILLDGAHLESCHHMVLADRQRLKQVFLNLLSNAIKYNCENGTVTIECEAKSGRLCVAVTDTGPGIAPEHLERLFTPFERLDADSTGVEGTGLGLALSKNLMEAMGGSIRAESSPGQGSTFLIELNLV